jgi:hypothetical protein
MNLNLCQSCTTLMVTYTIIGIIVLIGIAMIYFKKACLTWKAPLKFFMPTKTHKDTD